MDEERREPAEVILDLAVANAELGLLVVRDQQLIRKLLSLAHGVVRFADSPDWHGARGPAAEALSEARNDLRALAQEALAEAVESGKERG